MLNSLGEYATAFGVEMNAVDVKLPSVAARDLIKALPQDHLPNEVVTVERRERETGEWFCCRRLCELLLERLVERDVVRGPSRRNFDDDAVVGVDEVVEPRLNWLARSWVFSERSKRTQPDPGVGLPLQPAHDDGEVARSGGVVVDSADSTSPTGDSVTVLGGVAIDSVASSRLGQFRGASPRAACGVVPNRRK